MVNAAYPEKDKSKQKIREEIPPLRENDPFSKQGNEISEWFDTGVKERLGEDIKIWGEIQVGLGKRLIKISLICLCHIKFTLNSEQR